MLRLLLPVLCLMSVKSFATDVTGAGSSFVYPILSKWASAYKTESGHSINYQSIGSGGGIKQIQSKTVDFGATDMPLKPEELKQHDLVQFPIINGALVLVYNVEGIPSGALKLTGPVIADIFMGKIKKWNDPALVAVNKGTTLPDQDITVVRRSDGSGTTFILSNYLSKVSADWKSKMGEGTALNWDAANGDKDKKSLGGKGNEGVATYVKQLTGSIGYVEFAYAKENNMSVAQIKNKAGKFITPDADAFAAAAAGVDWNKAPGYYLIMTEAGGAKSWPIAGSTFILMQKNQMKPEQGKAALQFFRWVYKNGAASAKDLHYVPLPTATTKLIEKTWAQQITGVDVKSL